MEYTDKMSEEEKVREEKGDENRKGGARREVQ